MDEEPFWRGVEIGLRAAACISGCHRDQARSIAAINEYVGKVQKHREGGNDSGRVRHAEAVPESTGQRIACE